MPLRFQVLFKINEADCLIPVLVTRSFGVYTSLRLCLGLSSNRLSADTHSLRPQVFSSPVSPSVEDAQYFNRKWIQPSVPLKEHWFLLCSTQGQRREQAGRILSPQKCRPPSQSIYWRENNTNEVENTGVWLIVTLHNDRLTHNWMLQSVLNLKESWMVCYIVSPLSTPSAVSNACHCFHIAPCIRADNKRSFGCVISYLCWKRQHTQTRTQKKEWA